MTKLALINEVTYKAGVNQIGDVAGRFDDAQKIQPLAESQFDFVIVEETKTTIDIIIPETKQLTKAKTTEWTDAEPEEKRVWMDKDGKFKDINTQPKYTLNYDKDLKEIKETYSRYPENLVIQDITK